MTELRTMPDLLRFLRAAFLKEAGTALIRKYGGFDPLFTHEGFAAFVDDVLTRMVNPYLLDTVRRVGRDPRRKLGWEDRLVGTMRLAREYGVETPRYAFGAAAALATLEPEILEGERPVRDLLLPIWDSQASDQDAVSDILAQIERAMPALRAWVHRGCEALPRI
jgi:mannitol-1-phosphate 5-dehydrogenase